MRPLHAHVISRRNRVAAVGRATPSHVRTEREGDMVVCAPYAAHTPRIMRCGGALVEQARSYMRHNDLVHIPRPTALKTSARATELRVVRL